MQDLNTIKENIQQDSLHKNYTEKATRGQNIPMLFLAALLILVFIGLVGYISYQYGKADGRKEAIKTTNETETSNTTTTSKTISQDLTSYENPSYAYSLEYPSKWNLKESEEWNCLEKGQLGDGCYDYLQGSSIEITDPDNNVTLYIDYGSIVDGIIYEFRVFEKDDNFNEEEIFLFDKQGYKGYVYCTYIGGDEQKQCSQENLNMDLEVEVLYYYELYEIMRYEHDYNSGVYQYPSIIDTRFKLGSPKGDDREILLYASYSEYSKELDDLVDGIIESMRYTQIPQD